MTFNETFYLDTYAIFEIIRGSKDYAKYRDTNKMLTVFNIIEMHYKILREFDTETARLYALKYNKHIVDFSLQDIFDANEFRAKNKHKKMSFTDCLGYVLAKKKRIKFLTGDKEFEGLENVEFVK